MLVLGAATLLQSCLKNQEDLFDKPSSLRMNDYLTKAQTTLTGASNGWVFEYYPGKTQGYGGFTYTLKFNTNGTVEARKEGVKTAETTGYSLKSDAGPVLSFDTYSTLLHEYATPSSGAYQAKQGDYEFVIDSIGDDVIKMHGKRIGNTMYLYKLNESAEAYLSKVEHQRDLFWYDHTEGTIGKETGRQTFDLGSRQMNIGGNDVAYTFTDKGIRLYQPVEVGGKSVRNFQNDDATMQLKCVDDGATDVALKGTLSSSYLPGLLGAVNGAIRLGDDELTKTVVMSHLKDFKIEQTGDWFTLEANGENAKLTFTGNNTGHVRLGKVNYSLGDVKGTIDIVQSDFNKDIVGNYELRYDLGTDEGKVDAWITADRKLYFMCGADTLHISLRTPTSSSFSMECGQYLGEYTDTEGKKFYCYDIFLDAEGKYWTGYNRGYFYNGTFTYSDATKQQTCTFSGHFGSREIGMFTVSAFSPKSMTKANYKGDVLSFKAPYLVKKPN